MQSNQFLRKNKLMFYPWTFHQGWKSDRVLKYTLSKLKPKCGIFCILQVFVIIVIFLSAVVNLCCRSQGEEEMKGLLRLKHLTWGGGPSDWTTFSQLGIRHNITHTNNTLLNNAEQLAANTRAAVDARNVILTHLRRRDGAGEESVRLSVGFGNDEKHLYFSSHRTGRPIKRLLRGEISSKALLRRTSVKLLPQQVLIKSEKSGVDRNGDPNEHQELVLKSACELTRVFLNKLTRASVSDSFCLQHTMTESVTVRAAAHFPAVCAWFYFRAFEHRQFGFSVCLCVCVDMKAERWVVTGVLLPVCGPRGGRQCPDDRHAGSGV